MLESATAEYVDVILQVAARDPSIAGILREICALDASMRSMALSLMAAHLRARRVPKDVLDCVAMLRQDDVARRIAEALSPPSSAPLSSAPLSSAPLSSG